MNQTKFDDTFLPNGMAEAVAYSTYCGVEPPTEDGKEAWSEYFTRLYASRRAPGPDPTCPACNRLLQRNPKTEGCWQHYRRSEALD